MVARDFTGGGSQICGFSLFTGNLTSALLLCAGLFRAF